MTILVTGAAGFIGHHLSLSLLGQGERVTGIDNLNDYYDVSLKHARLSELQSHDGFSFHQCDIADCKGMAEILDSVPETTAIVHLAAQAGVRYSLVNPFAYQHSNLDGVMVLLEAARKLSGLKHFIFSSSSSVYGGLPTLPYKVTDNTDRPVSLYAATKKAGEAMCHSYAHLYGIPVTSLRFFTVYGPWGRPDMATFMFTKKILAGDVIDVFNDGKMRRDFTYVDDIVFGVTRCLASPPKAVDGSAPYAVYNLGNRRSEELMDVVSIIEREVGRKAEINYKPIQPGDVIETYADITDATADFGFEPKTNIAEGLPAFIRWYRSFYNV
ncbi:MAG: hypothetical protein CBD27_01180 [Rhodospirillaceae bacterium TMED167]|nr:protein CapI [Rhodospirillaceae bacterium]OUW30586.1 MAG: hypothetical protein CBD27_01180 [Rhodospirillaceae bacterium TMED167]